MLSEAITPMLEKMLLAAAKQSGDSERTRRVARALSLVRTELTCADIELQLLAEEKGSTAEQLFGDVL